MRRTHKKSPLPVRDGVSSQSVFLPEGIWPTVLAFLCERFPAVAAAQWQQRMTVGDVVNANGEPLAPNQPYLPGTRIYYYRTVEQEPHIPFEETILYQDEHLLVVDKPHFLPTQPAGPFVQQTLIARLRRRTGIDTLEPVHRLDRDTAGLVMVAKHPRSRNAYQALFRDHQVEKTYQAIAPYEPALTFPLVRISRIESSAQGFRHGEAGGPANAETCIRLLEHQGHWARYQLNPRTGKTHQLRVHMAALGIPIRNDPLYPVDLRRTPDQFDHPLQLLASALTFHDPLTGQQHCFRSQLFLSWPVL